ncbi:hypothetical protein CR513_45676, partial [Mucuna pruriens]
MEDKWQSLEERLRAMERGNQFGLEAVDLCLVPNVGLLANFKTSEFDKVHLAMYCKRMVAYIYDNILVHFFQDSLTKAALSWYVSLE